MIARLDADRDGAIGGGLKGIGEFPVAREVLPAIGCADESAAHAAQRRACRETQRESPPTCIAGTVSDPGTVVASGAAEVRSENEDQPIVTDQRKAHEQHIAQRVRKQLQSELVILAVMHDRRCRLSWSRGDQPVTAFAFQIDPAAVADQIESEVANLRLTCRRPIDLVDDAVSDGGPEPGTAECGGDEVFITRTPGRRDSRRAERFAVY